MFAGKGDSGFALRTRNNSVDLFVHAGGEWRSLYCEMPTDAASGWLGKLHQVAGIYDAEKNEIGVYVDGKFLRKIDIGTTAGVSHTDYPFTIGACPETGRGSQAEFYDCRVYSKALTVDELKSQNTSSPKYSASDSCVKLWLDFDNLSEATIMGDVNADGKFNVQDVVAFQKWLLGKGKLADAAAGDFTGEGKLDVFDMALMKKSLR